MIYTLGIPADIWLNLLDGAKLDGLWKFPLFYVPLFFGLNVLTGLFFHIEVEDGWGMLTN